ncbi:MAG: ABC transporter ATP-binding protein [Solirubrobacteraceae bacterium]
MATRVPLSLTPSPAAPLRAVPAIGGDTAVSLTGYGRRFGARTVMADITLSIAEGEFVLLLGASGSGKSTLLRALAGLDPQADGEVLVPRARTVVFQDHRLLPWKRVWRNVIVGLPDRAKADAVTALGEVGLAERADNWPGTLSGGESQRVALARAFIREPRLLLLDEPFGALDALTRIRMHVLMRALCERHRPTSVMVTHDVDEAIALATRVLVLRDGGISLDLPVDLPGRRMTDPGVADLRARLLGELGVTAE